MSIRRFLEIVYPQTPAFLKPSWLPGDPIRHVFMAGAIAHLAEMPRNRDKRLRLLEIGSWMGASCLTWAEALHAFAHGNGEITCVDSLTPYMDTEANKKAITHTVPELEHSQRMQLDEMRALLEENYVYDILMHNVGTVPPPVKVNVLRMTSREALPTFKNKSFDLVYIDGDHLYEPAKFDIENSIRLVDEGGIICGDDLNLHADEVDLKHAQANTHINYLTDPKTGIQYHPGVTLAVSELLGDVSCFEGFWAMQRVGSKFERVRLGNKPLVVPSHFPPEIREGLVARLRGRLMSTTAEPAPNPTWPALKIS